jgi:hypothetical protein
VCCGSGNFYWADCEHVAALPPIQTRDDPTTVSAFIFNVSATTYFQNEFGANCGYSPFHSGKNHFDTPVLFAQYANKLKRLLDKPALRLSLSKTPISYVNQYCKVLCANGKRYADEPDFMWGLALPPAGEDDTVLVFDELSQQSIDALISVPSVSELKKSSLGNDKDGLFLNSLNPDTLGLVRRQIKLGLQESALFDQAVKIARNERNYLITGFYHVSRWARHWREVVEEQLHILDGKRQFGDRVSFSMFKSNVTAVAGKSEKKPGVSDPNGNSASIRTMPWSIVHPSTSKLQAKSWASVLQVSDALHMKVVGATSLDSDKVQSIVQELPLNYKDKIKFSFNKTVPRGYYQDSKVEWQRFLESIPVISEGEYSTVEDLHQYCKAVVKENKKAIVYYLHSKGGCCSRINNKYYDQNNPKNNENTKRYPSNDPVSSWREGMNTFNFEYPSICLRALLRGHPVCGFEYQDAHFR